MKKLSLIISILFIITSVYAQETFTTNESQSNTSISGFGGPMLGVTQLNNGLGLAIGGKGGAVFNKRFAFGGLGYGMVNTLEFIGDDLSGNTNATLQMTCGAGGIFFEYILNKGDLLRFSIPVNIMAGGVNIYDFDKENEIESSAFFIIEPGFNIDIKVSNSYTQSLFLSYRLALRSSMVNLSNDAISGLAAGLLFKFGG